MNFQPQLINTGDMTHGTKNRTVEKIQWGNEGIKNKMPEQLAGFSTLLNSELAAGVLDFKTKEMISVALACYARCDYCIEYHVQSALKAGASPDEILEAAMVSVVFGGGPTMSYIATTLRECIEEFVVNEAKE